MPFLVLKDSSQHTGLQKRVARFYVRQSLRYVQQPLFSGILDRLYQLQREDQSLLLQQRLQIHSRLPQSILTRISCLAHMGAYTTIYKSSPPLTKSRYTEYQEVLERVADYPNLLLYTWVTNAYFVLKDSSQHTGLQKRVARFYVSEDCFSFAGV